MWHEDCGLRIVDCGLRDGVRDGHTITHTNIHTHKTLEGEFVFGPFRSVELVLENSFEK